jgi:hypothetical protein
MMLWYTVIMMFYVSGAPEGREWVSLEGRDFASREVCEDETIRRLKYMTMTENHHGRQVRFEVKIPCSLQDVSA